MLGLDGAYNSGPLRLSLGAGYRSDVRERISTTDRTETDPGTGDVTQSFERIDEHFHRLISSAQAAADWQLDQRQSLGASFSGDELNGRRFFDQVDTSGPFAGPVVSHTTRHSDGHEWHLDVSEEAHFEQTLWRPDETLKLQIQRSLTRERESYHYRNTAVSPSGPETFDDLFLGLDLVTTEFSVDYDLPTKDKRDFKLGYDLQNNENGFDNLGHSTDPLSGLPVVDPNVTDHFRYHQVLNSAAYDAPVGPWRLQAGLRAEWSSVSTLEITGNVLGAAHDVAVYPSLSLERSLNNSDKVLASLSRRVTWPDPEALNPFADHQDTHNLRAGDPNLLPQDTWSGQLGYTHSGALSWGGDLYYRLDRDSVTDIVEPLGDGVVLDTKANLPMTRSAGLEFDAGGKLGRQISYDVSGEAFYAQIDATSLGFPGLRATAGFNLKASLDYRPTGIDEAQISFSRTDRRLTPQGFVSPINLVNVGLRRQLRPDLALVFTLSNAFDGQKFRRIVASPTLTDAYLRYQIGRIAFLGAVWTFGVQPKGKGGGFEYEP